MVSSYGNAWAGLVGGGTLSPLAPVLGPEHKNWLCHPLPLLFMADQYDAKHVTFE